MAKIKNKTTADLKPDDRNANNHTEYGTLLLNKGIRQNGLGRSILISNDDVIIAGNGVTKQADEIGIKKVRIIETDGQEIIAVKRTDIKSGTREFYSMALSDNIISQENIAMDAAVQDAVCTEYVIEDWKPEPVKPAKPRAEKTMFQVIVNAKNKTDQAALYKELKEKGYICSIATS